ncbi:MAG: RtcB family protein [Thermoplasmata archaeon]
MPRDWKGPLKKLDAYRYEIPRSYKKEMRTSGIIYADEQLIRSIVTDFAPEQVANVATMPGVMDKVLAMPDIHWGYGMPVGGVAAFSAEEGVVSPGAVGYDINCGVRLLRTDLTEEDISPHVKALVDTVFVNVPSGVGSRGKVRADRQELMKVLEEGAEWAVSKGYGWPEDLDRIEANGTMPAADASKVSEKAIHRGIPQIGSLGAGNHFLEIQRVAKVHDGEAARAMGLEKGDVTVLIHTGSRGCGHQIATDYIRLAEQCVRKYDIWLPDRQLACMPVNSAEGQDYFAAMSAAANFAFANRQMITHWVRESFEKVLDRPADDLGLNIVYDVAHNMAKLEEHVVDGKRQEVYVHRKGATRAFPPNHPETPKKYKAVGQPVLIPGDMGTASFVLVGTEEAMKESFGSTCHGAGRQMSRTAATRRYSVGQVQSDLAKKGIYIHAASKKGIVEEAPGAYKDVESVVRVTEGAGISKIVVRLEPLGVMKG